MRVDPPLADMYVLLVELLDFYYIISFLYSIDVREVDVLAP
jgi:hypothetical protein